MLSRPKTLLESCTLTGCSRACSVVRLAAPGISATPYTDNLRYFNVIIQGPGHSCYEGGIFKLKIDFPADYPFKPPKIHFITKIWLPA